LRRKPGILNMRFVFLQHKNTKNKTNDLTRFFLGLGLARPMWLG